MLASALAETDRILFSAMNSEQRARNDYSTEIRKSLDSSSWLDLLAAAPEGPAYDHFPEPGSRLWLLDQLNDEDYRDERYVLRAVLMAFPDAEVTLDLTELRPTELDPFGVWRIRDCRGWPLTRQQT